ncbi:lipocalin-like domain-containing protein [Scleromatobacter humisilvae]|uniref:Carotenoid 1,2-hydratase n=1 Tax=Scleromatobacter humisilvae TaxID=2897159 RepID=A0A9X1YM76_9BURK|nr:lipocalin-like domain-containing protein [Scleromatobacter humisilvae]MCK9688556.1 carotenoid 1,2-hydratase [Scleromatobacter humisilvae]
MRRRPFLTSLPLALLAARTGAAVPDAAPLGVTHRALRFPADHGAHPDTHIEWWYVTGWLGAGAGQAGAPKPEFGFQVTFFRTRTGLAETSASRFAARQLVFAHVALTDLAAGAHGGGLMHDQRAAREGLGLVQTPAAAGSQVVQLRDWSLQRPTAATPDAATALRIAVRSDRFALTLDLAGTQPILLQGDAGYSQKGPDPRQASHYYSEPQLAVRGRVERAGAPVRDVRGRAWLDHEWSNELLPSEAVGWDWVGFNLLDGAALMAFRLRRADGSALWAGGSLRDAAGRLRVFGAGDVRFEPLRRWTSPRTQAAYPVEWTLATPAGRWRVVTLQDDQELDSRDSTGSVYWEGISALHDDAGSVAGYGYLELTGYSGKLRL